jgi:hypothetical protein
MRQRQALDPCTAYTKPTMTSPATPVYRDHDQPLEHRTRTRPFPERYRSRVIQTLSDQGPAATGACWSQAKAALSEPQRVLAIRCRS